MKTSKKVPGRAHTAAAKRKLLDRLFAAWLRAPEVRLGQMVAGAAYNVSGSFDAFNVEDDRLIAAIECAVRGGAPKRPVRKAASLDQRRLELLNEAVRYGYDGFLTVETEFHRDLEHRGYLERDPGTRGRLLRWRITKEGHDALVASGYVIPA